MNPKRPTPRLSAVREVAQALRRDVIDREEGALLGSEDDLIARYKVSRPTLRQAAGLVSQENLLQVKRGVGGGYFACRPHSKAVAHVAAVYLRSRHTRIDEVVRAVEPIRIELAKLAARSENAAARESLREFLLNEKKYDVEGLSFREFLRSERVFGRLLGELSGNKVISLFLDILYDFSSLVSPDEDMYVNRPGRVEEYRAKRNRLAHALMDSDEEMAVLAAKRCGMTTPEWVMGDLAADTRSPNLQYFAEAGATKPTVAARPVAKRSRAADAT